MTKEDKILKRQAELLKEMNRTLMEPYRVRAQEDPVLKEFSLTTDPLCPPLKIIDSLPGMGRENGVSMSVKDGEVLIKRIVDGVHLEQLLWPEFRPSPELFSQLGLPAALLDPPPREPGNIYYLETIPRKGDIHPRVMRRDLLSFPFTCPVLEEVENFRKQVKWWR